MTALLGRSRYLAMAWREPSWRCILRAAAAWLALALVALFLARAPLAVCLATIGGLIAGVVFLLRPHIALYLLAFSIPFGARWSFSLGGLTIGPSEALLAALLATWAIRMAAHRRVHVRRSFLALGLLAYLFTVLVSFLPAHNLVAALKELFKWLATLLVFLYVSSNAGRAEPVSTLGNDADGLAKQISDRTNVRRRENSFDPRILIAALLLAGLFEGALGIYQFLYRIGPPAFVLLGRYMRASGTFAQPNPYGGYMGLLLPVAYVLVLTRGRGVVAAARHGDWGPLLLWGLALVSLPVMSAALIMSWSRGALLGLAGGLAMVILALGWRVWLPVFVALLALLFIGTGPLDVLPAGFVGRALEVTAYLDTRDLAAVEINDSNFAVIERVAHWRAAWLMFERWPWLGVGAGQYAAEYPAVALPRWQDPLGHAHNYILHVMAEGGLVGLAGYLILSLASFAVLWRTARGLGKDRAAVAMPRSTFLLPRFSWAQTIGLTALGMWGHLMAHNLFDNLYVHGMYLLVAAMLGLAVAASPARRTSPILRMAVQPNLTPSRHHDILGRQNLNPRGH